MQLCHYQWVMAEYIGHKFIISKALNTEKLALLVNRCDVVHLEIDVVDKFGHFVPEASNRLHLTSDGPAKLIGVEKYGLMFMGYSPI